MILQLFCKTRNSIICLSTLIAMFLINSCVETPNQPISNDVIIGNSGVFVLCEGLWGSDNATLSRIDISRGIIINNYYRKANSNLRLGDNASDIAIKGDTVFVTVSTGSAIEAFSKIDGKFIGRIHLPENSQPRNICIINDTLAYVTLLYKHSIVKFNPTTLELQGETIEVGPFPEGIAYLNDYLFIANSGFGDYFHHLPKAGTISVVDINSNIEVNNLAGGKNLIEVVASPKNNKIYALYYNLPSMTDSLGGIIEYDAGSFEILNHWKVRATDITLSAGQDTLFFLSGNTDEINGVDYICLSKIKQIERRIANPNKSDIWYSLSISPDGQTIWVGNAKTFRSDGEILVFGNYNNAPLQYKFSTGVNPNKILFF